MNHLEFMDFCKLKKYLPSRGCNFILTEMEKKECKAGQKNLALEVGGEDLGEFSKYRI